MFDIGFAELLLCAIVALLVLGPERLPGTVRTVGRWIGRARHTVNQFTDQIDREIRAEELKRRIEEELKKSGVNDVARQVKEALHAPLPTPLIGADHLRDGAAHENNITPPALQAASTTADASAAQAEDDHADVAPVLRGQRAAGLKDEPESDDGNCAPVHHHSKDEAQVIASMPAAEQAAATPANPAQGNSPA